MPSGRPAISAVRNNVAKILFVAGELTAYEVYKHYTRLFPQTSQRNVYYQLKRGCDMDLFVVSKDADEQGEYSWGSTARKVYYAIKNKEGILLDERIHAYFQGLSKKE